MTQPSDAHRDQVEQKANLLRERLLRTIDALDERRHTMLSVRGQAERHRAGLEVIGAGLALLGGVGVALAVHRMRTRDERLRRERLEAVARLWRHPDRIARKPRGLLFQIARAVLVSAATAAGVALARRGVRHAQWALAAPVDGAPAELVMSRK
jgi:capsule polysaccharide export protein KpsC/LpsZ